MQRCVLVGETALAVQCAELLLRRRYTLEGVVSEDPVVQLWARRRGLAVCPDIAEVEAFAAERSFDLLLSIVNPHVIPATVLAQARRLAINYHDSLLPAYAGSHAAIWALIRGEARTGVTWHRMVARADAGDILVQQAVAVAADETAQSLATKLCFTAIVTFGALLQALARDSVQAIAQGPRNGEFFRRYRRPTPACLIDGCEPAETVERRVRALTFGTQWNPLGLPTIVVDGRVRRVERARVDTTSAPVLAAPGTVLARDGTNWRVATTTLPVELVVEQDVDSAESTGPSAGVRLSTWRSEGDEALELFDRDVCREERAWLNLFRAHPWLAAARTSRPLVFSGVLTVHATGNDAVERFLAEVFAAVAAVAQSRQVAVWTRPASAPTSLLRSLYVDRVPTLVGTAGGLAVTGVRAGAPRVVLPYLADFETRLARAGLIASDADGALAILALGSSDMSVAHGTEAGFDAIVGPGPARDQVTVTIRDEALGHALLAGRGRI